jgi:hypothetical protein
MVRNYKFDKSVELSPRDVKRLQTVKEGLKSFFFEIFEKFEKFLFKSFCSNTVRYLLNKVL